MRRSGAPSQLCGNVAKKPRFVPPASMHMRAASVPEPKRPSPPLCNALNKVPAPQENKSEAPVLSKALARILNAVPLGDTEENSSTLQGLSDSLTVREEESDHRTPDAGQSGDPERHEIPRSRTWPHFHTASLLGPGSTGAHSEEGPRPATRGAGSSEESAHAGADAVRESPAMHCPSSASVTLASSPSSPALSPPTEVPSSSPTVDGPLQGVPRWPLQKSLRLTREEQEAKLENQRRLGLYIRLKREGLRKRQQLEEELLWARIKVEKLRAARLKRGLPELNCC